MGGLDAEDLGILVLCVCGIDVCLLRCRNDLESVSYNSTSPSCHFPHIAPCIYKSLQSTDLYHMAGWLGP